jgi:hypothetical protein
MFHNTHMMEFPLPQKRRNKAASPSRREVERMNSQDTIGAAGTPQRRDYGKLTPQETAFKAIADERKYQDQKWGTQERPIQHEVDLIVAFSHKLEDAVGKSEPRDIIREIAALCVRSMEQHGTVARKPDDAS